MNKATEAREAVKRVGFDIVTEDDGSEWVSLEAVAALMADPLDDPDDGDGPPEPIRDSDSG